MLKLVYIDFVGATVITIIITHTASLLKTIVYFDTLIIIHHILHVYINDVELK